MDDHHALVTSGGASHGAWQLGFAREWVRLRPETNPRIFAGTSVGGLFSAFAAMHANFPTAIRELNQLWDENVRKTGDVYRTWWPSWLGPLAYLPGLWKGSVFNAEPLQKLIQKRFDPSAASASGKRLLLTAVDLRSGRLIEYDGAADWRPVYATAAYPLGFQMLDDGAGRLLTDGGVREVAPLSAAIRAGATSIDVLLTEPASSPEWEDSGGVQKLVQRGLRTAQLLVNEVLENDVRLCRSVNVNVARGTAEPGQRYVDVRVHRPKTPLHESSLNFHRKVWEVNRERGEADARLWIERGGSS